jgi:hypothetical protein
MLVKRGTTLWDQVAEARRNLDYEKLTHALELALYITVAASSVIIATYTLRCFKRRIKRH